MTNHGPNPYILWVDLETTGVEDMDEIVEIGAILTNEHLEEIDRLEMIFGTSRILSEIEPHVLQMHAENGLLYELNGKTMAEDREGEILSWLGQHGALKLGRLPIAGSGVGHFDRRFIRKYWPKLENRLQYWTYDVGVMRRLWRLASGKTLGEDAFEGKTHRAMDDIEQHLQEARLYIDTIRTYEKMAS